MDLTATLGYKSVVDMLNNLDSNEYEFWLRKYEKACFGPSVNNNMLAQVALYLVSVFGGKDPNIKFDKLMIENTFYDDSKYGDDKGRTVCHVRQVAAASKNTLRRALTFLTGCYLRCCF